MFFHTGQNCWQLADAGRISFLIDGEAYFRAFADSCETAQKAIYIIGWDVDSRIRLRRDSEGDQETLGKFVDRLAQAKPELDIYILDWDFSMLYSLERESLPQLSLGWQTHARVHFELDEDHPVGASHHQKIVVIDDRVAFVGGFDLASCRWDTQEHADENPARFDNATEYGPFHDVQMMVDGEVAALIGELARYRWERATGDRLPEVAQSDQDPWPENIIPDLEKASVAILRTLPGYDGEPEVREIEQFYRDAIAGAETSIYIESQYLTSHVIGEALENSLHKEKGPEILLVLPKRCSGWLEEETMGALRQHLLQRFRNADENRRLKICYPDREALESAVINVHSKVLVVDDNLLTVGSANLSNRSMGFDTECNLALSADDQPQAIEAIASLRNRLLAEHLGTDPDRVAATLKKTGSLLKTVNALNSSERTLKDLPEVEEIALKRTLSMNEFIDPERPIGFEQLLEHLGARTSQHEADSATISKAWRFTVVMVIAIALAITWRLTPLGEWLNLDELLATADAIRESAMTVPIVLFIYVVGSCLMFPVTLMILATALSFGPFMGFALAFGGSLLGGLASYLLGRWLGRDVVRKFAGDKLNQLSRKLARRGWLAVAVIRIIPIAPFTIVNMVAGSTHISTRSFLVGTAVGMGPGILAIMLFEGGLEHAIREPSWLSVATSITALGCAALILVFGRRWLLHRDKNHDR